MNKSILLILILPLIASAQAANQFRQVTFSNLGVPADNNVRYVVDGAVDPSTGNCIGGGFGAYAFRLQTGSTAFVWRCSVFAPGGALGGDVSSNTSTSTVGQAAVFSSTNGKQIGRFTSTGFVNALSGVLGTQSKIHLNSDVDGNLPVANLNNGSNAGPLTFWSGDGTWKTPPGAGTVTEVAATAPSGFSFTGSPINNSGTLALIYASGQLANRFLATPNGSTGPMGLRQIQAADILLSGVTNQRCLRVDSSGFIVVASNDCATGGSVNSVAMTVPAFLSVSGSPITTTGTFALTLANQNANQIFAGPTTGSANTPSFRALVAADVPGLDAAKIISGTINPGRLGGGTLASGFCLNGDSVFRACGSGGTPGGSPGQFQFNNTTFGGATNFTYTSATGQVTANQLANGNDVIYGKRVTDSSSTGNFLRFQNQTASSDLFKVDVAGNTTVAGSLTMASTSGTDGILTVSSTASGGGVQLTSGTKPTCDTSKRGLIWYVAGGISVADTIQICAKNSSNSFAWINMATIP